MSIGSDNLSNGSATAQARFSGGVSAYRQNRRDAHSSDVDGALGSRRDGLPTRSPGMSGLSTSGLSTSGLSTSGLEPTSALDRAAKLPSLDLQGLTEPVFPGGPGSDSPSQSMADHPLLRGLLLELPARGTMPPSD